MPPGGKRFEVVVEGVENGELMKAWSQLCQPTDGAAGPGLPGRLPVRHDGPGEPRSGSAAATRRRWPPSIQKLFQKKLGKPLKVRVEE